MDNYYVYVHYRLDTDAVFYVGKGKDNRAYNKTQRNPHWKRIVSKHGRRVQIIESNMSEQSAFDLEIELIAQYGRENLANLTIGGEGTSGYKSESAIQNKIALMEYIKANEVPPIRTTKLSELYFRYVRSTSSPAYDPILAEEVYSIRPEWREIKKRSIEDSQALVMDFIDRFGYIPYLTSKDPVEKRLGHYCNNVRAVNGAGMYDKTFSDYLDSKIDYTTFICNIRKNEVKEFCIRHNRNPSTISKNKDEKLLGFSMRNYCLIASKSYDPEFRQWALDNGFFKPKVLREGRLVGTSLNKKTGKWTSKISINGVPTYLGYFSTEQLAHDAYTNALKNVG